MNKNTAKIVRPIRFARLEVGSKFTIFAEPTRGIQHSEDKAVYTKMAESYSEKSDDATGVIILYPEDLVVPRSRPKN